MCDQALFLIFQVGPGDKAKPYLLDQTPLSISRRSRIVAAPPDMLNEIVATHEY